MFAAVAWTLAGCWSSPAPTAGPPEPILVLAVPQGPPGAPLQDAACRRALFAALDRVAAARSMDPAGSWQPAYALSPPGLASYDPHYRQFPDGQGRGDLPSALADLAECGHPDGFTTTLGLDPGLRELGSPAEVDGFVAAIRSSLTRAGIDLVVADQQGLQASPPEVVLLQLESDSPGVSAFFDPLVRSGQAGDLSIAALTPLLAQEAYRDPGLERERGRMIDRLVLSTLRYLPLATKPN